MQILAKPSMMNPEGAAPAPQHHHGQETAVASHGEKQKPPAKKKIQVPKEFQEQLESVYTAYFDLQQALSQDNPENARKAANASLSALDKVDMNLLEEESHEIWMKILKALMANLNKINKSEDIQSIRENFNALSQAMKDVARMYGATGKQPIMLYYCPMAFDDRGAEWLQNKEGVENPYFGSMMFRCGEIRDVLIEGPGSKQEHNHDTK
jgi:Cu(I)/Ag(I) efflux system membrane fusion protein